MKKVLILYDSVFGNTKKVAMSLSRGLEAGGLQVDSYFIEDFDIVDLTNYDIIGIGSPTHYHGASKKMKSFLNRIKHLKMEAKYGFAFETKGDFRLAGSAAKSIVRYLNKIKVKIIHPIITGIVLDQEGPLKDVTLDLMEQVGLNISDNVKNSKMQSELNRGFKIEQIQG
jgi:flavodoxin